MTTCNKGHPRTVITSGGRCLQCDRDRHAVHRARNAAARELYDAIVAAGVPADAERIAQAWALLDDQQRPC